MAKLDETYRQYLAISIQKELCNLLSLEAEVYLPGSERFEDSQFRFTEYGRPTFIAAVYPKTYLDVANSIRYAHTRGIPCTAKGGGHCVSSSMQTLQDGIVIDLQPLKEMNYDEKNQEVTAGGGVLSGEFLDYIHGFNMETNVGSCPTTGLMGVAIGGGIGRLQGKYGYLSDNITSCKIALADGSIVEASATNNPDLFWGVCGAGHNFGIVVEATFKVYPQQHGGLHHNWDFEFQVGQARAVFEVLNRWVGKMVPNLAVFVLWKRVAASGAKNVILVNAVWSGPLDEADEYISQLHAISPIVPSAVQTVEWPELSWIALQGINRTYLGSPESWNLYPYKLFAAASAKTFDIDTMCDIFQALESMTADDNLRALAMFEVFSHHRAQEIPDDATAFPWRHGSDIFQMLQVSIKDPKKSDACAEWLNQWKRTMIAKSGYPRLQQYANYGHGTNQKDPVEALYGYDKWRMKRLRGLKAKYDEKNWFRWYQPIIDPTDKHG
ncbi:unnamed protein product [Periconia digitata]|uniref:FAD-binding PCMH-type domain-containing protein n=1 Tax=Periconia digitata TaxID=1303443 RepID=A0A9W4UM11_9PLEO|nr:unnamed protein product [Periconia digitata]